MISALLSMIGSAVAGGATGLIGTIATKVVEFKTRQVELEYELKGREIDIQEIKLESERDIAVANIEAQAATDVAAANLTAKSYEADQAKYGEKLWWIDAIRGVMRPMITAYMMVIMTWIATEIAAAVGGIDSMDSNQVWQLWILIIESIIYLTTTAVTWWFGSRPSSRRTT